VAGGYPGLDTEQLDFIAGQIETFFGVNSQPVIAGTKKVNTERRMNANGNYSGSAASAAPPEHCTVLLTNQKITNELLNQMRDCLVGHSGCLWGDFVHC